MDVRPVNSSAVELQAVYAHEHQHSNESLSDVAVLDTVTAKLPDCHNYPAIGTIFTTVDQFRQFKKFFCHMRNANFQAYNNSTSAIYLCPNYKQCKGIIHGYRNKKAMKDQNGNLQYDQHGYLKYKSLPLLTIGSLTNPCNCMPDWCTSIKDSSKVFDRMLYADNVSRTEFTHLANSYFAIAGKDNYSFKSTGYNLTWKCLLCSTGCLQLTMNRNKEMTQSKYQSYGKITKASPCSRDCPSRTCSYSKKTVWLPRSYVEQEMALTTEQIELKKQRHNIWASEARTIAQELLTQQQVHKKPWKFSYMSEHEIRKEIQLRNTKIAETSRNRAASTKLATPQQTTTQALHSSTSFQYDKTSKPVREKGKPIQTKPKRRSSRIQKK